MPLLNQFRKFESAKQCYRHLVMVIDADVGDDLMEQLFLKGFQWLLQLVNQRFQLSDIFQHGEDLGLKAAVSLGFQLIELLANLPRLRMVNIRGEVSLRA